MSEDNNLVNHYEDNSIPLNVNSDTNTEQVHTSDTPNININSDRSSITTEASSIDTSSDTNNTESVSADISSEQQDTTLHNPSEVGEPLPDNHDNVSPNKFSFRKIDFKTFDIYKLLRLLFAIGFVVFSALFINEVFIEPYRISKSIEQTRDLYSSNEANPVINTQDSSPTLSPGVTEELSPTEGAKNALADPTRDAKGRLLRFKRLLEVNEDAKGWLTIPDTNMDYVVMQSQGDPEFYLTHDLYKHELKAGSLFLDYKSSLEKNTQNLVIHGHNMKSTDNMFHYLVEYKKLDFYKDRPVFTFDTIYQTGNWKVFAVFITNGSNKKEPLFDYTQSSFQDASDFLNFVYQIRVRSLLNIDTVDVNENDQILGLSTCSYEITDYRTVVFARKIREGEDQTVDVKSVKKNPHPLYPRSFYKNYGGKAPKLAETFEEALQNGDINWYRQN
jgi:sortase B